MLLENLVLLENTPPHVVWTRKVKPINIYVFVSLQSLNLILNSIAKEFSTNNRKLVRNHTLEHNRQYFSTIVCHGKKRLLIRYTNVNWSN